MNDPADCAYMSQRLGAEPVVLDSADASRVSRPRLWWLNTEEKIQWSQHIQRPQASALWAAPTRARTHGNGGPPVPC